MTCISPVLLDETFLVPCGKCSLCRKARASEWATRIVHELSTSKCGAFITLTYSDEFLPEELDKSCLQRFIKRVRKRIYPRKVKYYACGEYGDLKGRPHYHLIMFNIDLTDEIILQSCWKYGHVFMGSVTYQSARYVANYVQKKGKYFGGKTKPFQLQSQGIGKDFAIKYADDLIANMSITVEGIKRGLPRYYKKKLEIPTSRLLEYSKELSNELLKKIQCKYKILDNEKEIPEDWAIRLKQARKLKLQEFKAKEKLYITKKSMNKQ